MLNLHALLTALAVASIALAVLLGIFFWAYRLVMITRARSAMDRVAPKLEAGSEPSEVAAQMERAGLQANVRWDLLDRWRSSEDARLLLRAGYRRPAAPSIFNTIRFLLPAVLVVVTGMTEHLLAPHMLKLTFWMSLVAVAIFGYLLPKFILESKAKSRGDAVNAEIPFFVDMLALLQGVGLSLEQSLASLAQTSEAGIPLLAGEMREMSKHIAIGRPRVEAMQKLAEQLGDADFEELVNMLRQIERFGGDVAQPLRDFAGRLQEKRQMALRERVGKLNVKMTAVMTLTMLPALLLITAGPAVLALLRFFDKMG
ncbi:MAG: type II secretion system F family protein [Gammaproteobacteria bacterium]|nr:type II secretion system F family protein [Gammaproteobacteria bacterium]